MKRILGNKKAVSPVVSAVIMILVVMIGMSALFGFFVNYAKDFQLGSGSSVLESMTVEDVWLKTSNTEIWIYNLGKVQITIGNIYINDSLAVLPDINGKPQNLTIQIGEHGLFIIDPPAQISFASGNSYTLKIVTTRGTTFEGKYEW